MIRWLLVSAVLVGVLCAQQPARGPGARFGGGRLGAGGPMSERRLANQLSLDSVQLNKVHAAIEEARVAQQGLDQKMFDLRSQLATAIKSANEGNIDRVSQDIANVHQQQTSIHAKLLARIYASLNAQQQAQFDRMISRDLGVARGRRFATPGNGAQPPRRQQ